jgi:hypothetical protein
MPARVVLFAQPLSATSFATPKEADKGRLTAQLPERCSRQLCLRSPQSFPFSWAASLGLALKIIPLEEFLSRLA